MGKREKQLHVHYFANFNITGTGTCTCTYTFLGVLAQLSNQAPSLTVVRLRTSTWRHRVSALRSCTWSKNTKKKTKLSIFSWCVATYAIYIPLSLMPFQKLLPFLIQNTQCQFQDCKSTMRKNQCILWKIQYLKLRMSPTNKPQASSNFLRADTWPFARSTTWI